MKSNLRQQKLINDQPDLCSNKISISRFNNNNNNNNNNNKREQKQRAIPSRISLDLLACIRSRWRPDRVITGSVVFTPERRSLIIMTQSTQILCIIYCLARVGSAQSLKQNFFLDGGEGRTILRSPFAEKNQWGNKKLGVLLVSFVFKVILHATR